MHRHKQRQLSYFKMGWRCLVLHYTSGKPQHNVLAAHAWKIDDHSVIRELGLLGSSFSMRTFHLVEYQNQYYCTQNYREQRRQASCRRPTCGNA